LTHEHLDQIPMPLSYLFRHASRYDALQETCIGRSWSASLIRPFASAGATKTIITLERTGWATRWRRGSRPRTAASQARSTRRAWVIVPLHPEGPYEATEPPTPWRRVSLSKAMRGV
jgi:hypothetical protein